MSVLTDDCDLHNVHMQTLMGGNGDYYITLYEYPSESCENFHMISYRMAMSGGFTHKYPEVRKAFVALYRVMEAAGLNEFPNGGSNV